MRAVSRGLPVYTYQHNLDNLEMAVAAALHNLNAVRVPLASFERISHDHALFWSLLSDMGYASLVVPSPEKDE